MRYLFRLYPALRDRVSWTPLGHFPTPVRRLAVLGQRLGWEQLWVKEEDQTGERCGGNKVRPLEFLLPAVHQRGYRRVLVIAPWGSHYALAVAAYAPILGLEVTALLGPCPLTPHVQRNLLQLQVFGARVVHLPTWAFLPAALLREFLGSPANLSASLPALLPPGGTSPLGCLGYVEAALELAAQVAAGELPEPEVIVVALGTGGTMAGLEVGCRLAGLKARILGVDVVGRWFARPERISNLCRRTVHLLHSLGAEVAEEGFPVREVWIEHGFLGTGYGHSTPEVEAALKLAAETEGLYLEPTYTGKALAALLHGGVRFTRQRRAVLFWNTAHRNFG
ncbi:MAG TPA: pyridoxal-phosphate dependent enzyme [Armatimonadetes bacterium]|nr:pyridoxal-phosphate dependent enzyme [Armatimonadota bacterium]